MLFKSYLFSISGQKVHSLEKFTASGNLRDPYGSAVTLKFATFPIACKHQLELHTWPQLMHVLYLPSLIFKFIFMKDT